MYVDWQNASIPKYLQHDANLSQLLPSQHLYLQYTCTLRYLYNIIVIKIAEFFFKEIIFTAFYNCFSMLKISEFSALLTLSPLMRTAANKYSTATDNIKMTYHHHTYSNAFIEKK